MKIKPTNRYRRRRFAIEYAAIPNGRQAAISAGYSPKSAHVQANRLLRHPEVVSIIGQLRVSASKKIGLLGMATLDRARSRAVLSIADYWVLDVIKKSTRVSPPLMALRLKTIDELSFREWLALAPESFDPHGNLVQIALRKSVPAIVELGRAAGVPGYY